MADHFMTYLDVLKEGVFKINKDRQFLYVSCFKMTKALIYRKIKRRYITYHIDYNVTCPDLYNVDLKCVKLQRGKESI